MQKISHSALTLYPKSKTRECLTLSNNIICKILLLTPKAEPPWQFCGFTGIYFVILKPFQVIQKKPPRNTLILSLESIILILNLSWLLSILQNEL